MDDWDYRRSAFYFVTICTNDRRHFFGDIRDGRMGLSVQGCVAWYFWNQIPIHFDNVVLDAFVVMPNHVHGIIQIQPNQKKENLLASRHGVRPQDHERPQDSMRPQDYMRPQDHVRQNDNVRPPDHMMPNYPKKENLLASCHGMRQQEKIREFGKPKSGSLSVILNHYKGAVTRWCNHKGYKFEWQSRFYDHIIRNEQSLDRIREYIKCNPLNWVEDMDNIF